MRNESFVERVQITLQLILGSIVYTLVKIGEDELIFFTEFLQGQLRQACMHLYVCFMVNSWLLIRFKLVFVVCSGQHLLAECYITLLLQWFSHDHTLMYHHTCHCTD